MADLSDVVDGIAALLASAFYPDGPGTASVIDGLPVVIKPGWPLAADLDAKVGGLKALMPERGAYVSVFAPPNLERATIRAMAQWLKVGPPTHTLTVSVSDRSVTVGGTVAVPQNVAVTVDGRAYAYAVQSADTLGAITAGLVALMVADGLGATASGATLTIPSARVLGARVGSVQRLAKEVERTQRSIMTTVWAPTPQLRARIGRVVKARLADTSDLVGCHNRFLPLCDGSAAWIVYDHTNDWDQDQRVGIYRRDLSHWFEFGEYLTVDATEIVVGTAGSFSPTLSVAPSGEAALTFP